MTKTLVEGMPLIGTFARLRECSYMPKNFLIALLSM